MSLSRLTNDEPRTAANHYHFAVFMNNAEQGSVPLLITSIPTSEI
jgi:hypothetical protein